MNTKEIDPSKYPKDHPLAVALRITANHWQLAHSKLMSLQWIESTAVPYGATDGLRLLLNPAGIDKLCRQQNATGLIAFLLVHEAMHALLGHGWRLARLPDHDLANRAADYIINAMIAHRNAGLRRTLHIDYDVFPLIEGVLYDEQLSGDKSAERLYKELMRPQPPQQPQPQPQPAEADDTDEGDDEGAAGGDTDEGDDEAGDDEGDSDAADDSGSGGDGGSDDTEGDNGGGAAGDDDDLSDFVGTGAPDNIEPESGDLHEAQEIIDRIEQSNDRILFAEEVRRRQDEETDTTGQQRIAGQRVRPSSLRWPDMLREWLLRTTRAGWDGPHNQPVYSTTGLVCAGRQSRRAGDIVLVIDSSGSIGRSTYDRFLQEAQSILDELKPDRLHLLSVSHRVMDYRELQAGDYAPQSLRGGGMTLFLPAFTYLQQHSIYPEVLVYLTDGISPDVGCLEAVDYPVLWLSTCAPPSAFNIGHVIEVDDF